MTEVAYEEPYLNLQNLERSLVEHLAKSLSSKNLVLDLQNITWLSPLSLCLLFNWALLVKSRGGTVLVRPPPSATFAGCVFGTVNAAAVFQENGIDYHQTEPPSNFREERLAALSVFLSRRAALRYVDDLQHKSRAQYLLRVENLPEFVTSGHFNQTALRELAKNVFDHTPASTCIYAALDVGEAPGSGRATHPIFAGFGGRSYLELCVADLSPHNIVDTLHSFMPTGYQPTGVDPKYPGSLTDFERCAFYAFEYGATSKPQQRRAQFKRAFEQDESVSVVGTGLFDIAAIANFYGGQVVFRVGAIIGTLDFSVGRVCRRSVLRKVGRHKLIDINGSIISLRIPTETAGKDKLVVPIRRPPTEGVKPTKLHVIPIGGAELTKDESEVERFISLEERAVQALGRDVERQAGESAVPNTLVIVVVDGLGLSAKSFSALLLHLSRIPRRAKGLAIISSDASRLVQAKTLWNEITQRGEEMWLRYPSFVVAADNGEIWSGFGSHLHVDATTAQNESIHLPSGRGSILVRSAVDSARQSLLQEAIQSDEVCHSEGLYLIENLYYTPRFYEIRKLVTNDCTRSLLFLWLRSVLGSIAPANVICGPAFMFDLARESLNAVSISPPAKLHRLESRRVVSLAVQATEESAQATVIVTDVVCTGRFIRRFAQLIPDPSRLRVIAIVDARLEGRDYLPVELDNRTIDIPITAIHRDGIAPVYDRPADIRIEDVLIVDPLTHAPTRYPLPRPADRSTDILLKTAEKAGALSAGHYVFQSHHYVYFFSFRETFDALSAHLKEWFQEGIQGLVRTANVELSSLSVYCLDDETNLVAPLAEVLRDAELRAPLLLSKDELKAPPLRSRTSGDALWFVLPAMASGRTLRQCLEFAQAVGATRVLIFVVAGRIAQERTLFYQNLRGYRKLRVEIRFLFSMPLVSYEAGACPMCGLKKTFDALAESVGISKPHLQGLIKEESSRLAEIPVQNVNFVEVKIAEGEGLEVWREASARVRFEDAIGDQAIRPGILKSLRRAEEAQALAAAIGREVFGEVFSSENIKKVFYDRGEVERAAEAWTRTRIKGVAAFQRQLRGFSKLAPERIGQSLPSLLSSYADSEDHLKILLIEAVRIPSQFVEAIETFAGAGTALLRPESIELRDFILRGSGGEDVPGVLAAHELRWHLTRSSGWGGALELFRIKARRRTSFPERLEAWRRFLRDGLQEGARRLRRARDQRLFWERLGDAGDQVVRLWEDVVQQVRAAGLLVENEAEPGPLLAGVDGFQNSVQRMVEVLDGAIAQRAGPAMESLQTLLEGVPSAGHIQVEVDSLCPAIAITETDFQEAMFQLLDNARIRGPEEAVTRLRFRPPSVGSSFVFCEVSQSWEWRLSDPLEGGLARIRQILAIYGAALHLEERATAGENFLRMRFFRWPIEKEISANGEEDTDS